MHKSMFLLGLVFLLFSSHVNAQVAFQQDGTFIGSRPIINCGNNITCKQNPGQNRIDLKVTVPTPTPGGSIQSLSRVTLLTSVNIPLSNILNNILTQNVTMPSTGCPCKVIVFYNILFGAGGGSNMIFEGIVDDNQVSNNTFASAAAFAMPFEPGSFNSSGVSFNSYNNGQVVSVTLKAQTINTSGTVTTSFVGGVARTYLQTGIITGQ